jgi:ABC-type polysaccharide/polyol phosphate export permease
VNTIIQVKTDLKKYKEYILYTIKTDLKTQLSSTYLGYLWWLLDPLLYMLVYVFVAQFIFRSNVDNFPIFVFCGVLPWKWITSSLTEGTSSIKSRLGVLQQVYMPKFILPLIKCISNAIKFLFGTIVLIILMAFFKIKPSIHNAEFIFILLVNFVFVLGCSLLLAHLGVFFRDINNVLTFVFRLWFYLSPGFYTIDRMKEYEKYMWLNPLTALFQSYRNVFMYNQSPHYKALFIWLVISLWMCYLGVKRLYKFDKNYTKVV